MKTLFFKNLTQTSLVMLLGLFVVSPSCRAESPFNYGYKTELVLKDNKGIELPQQIESFAFAKNKYLNQSPMFDTSFIRDQKKVRSYHLKPKFEKENVGQVFDLVTDDRALVSCTYFDRGSDKLLIVGEGFTNFREYMTPFVAMFDCDVVLFDFRGHGYRDFSWFDLDSWTLNLAKVTFDMDSSVAKLGEYEEKDVFTVVDFFKNRKQYKQVNGLGLCYSAFIFLKAAALRTDLFNKIILDGCWLSLPLLIDKLKKDPKMLCSPQTGGWSKTWPWQNSWAQEGIVWFAANIWGLEFHDTSLLDYLPLISKNASLLFFYGKDDLMVNRAEWELLWEHLAHVENKAAVITSNPHVRNHFKQKELYKLVGDLFFDLDFKEFTQHITDVNVLLEYQTRRLYDLAGL